MFAQRLLFYPKKRFRRLNDLTFCVFFSTMAVVILINALTIDLLKIRQIRAFWVRFFFILHIEACDVDKYFSML